MTSKDKQVLIDRLRQLSADVADLATALEGTGAPVKKQDVPTETKTPDPDPVGETPAKVYSKEDVRAILADKARSGFRAEVKALLTAHGAKQLSDITDPEELANLVAEAEVIGNG